MVHTEALLSCILQLLTGASFIFLNERIMKRVGYPYPMMISFLGFAGSSIISATLIWTGMAKRNHKTIQWHTIGPRVILLSLFVTSSVVTGMAAYLYLSISFIQMLKATTPVMTMALLLACDMLPFHLQLVASTCAIVCGAVISGFGEGGLSWLGVGIMLLSCLSEATRCVLTQSLLEDSKLTVVEGLYLMSPPCTIAALMAVSLFEKPALNAKGLETIASNPMIFVMAGSLGFIQHLCTLWVVQATNALTLKLLGPLRSIFVVGVSVVFWGDSLSTLKATGYMVSLLGLLWYNLVQINMRKHRKEPIAVAMPIEMSVCRSGSRNSMNGSIAS
ncbi:hypothetical protein AAMO2058_000508400 [Amorphochlora amoebiformis]